MATELRKLGAAVEEGPDWLRIVPATVLRSAAIDTYDDHRMAMCFALVSLAVPIRINDPDCVNKTYPGFFAEFGRLVRAA
jgi:3-phosphoshikimate 1-carboxyvinyltransferase